MIDQLTAVLRDGYSWPTNLNIISSACVYVCAKLKKDEHRRLAREEYEVSIKFGNLKCMPKDHCVMQITSASVSDEETDQ